MRKDEQLERREEARRHPLKLRDQLKLQRGRFDAVLGVRMDRPQRLLLERGVAAVIHEHRLQRRGVDGCRRPAQEHDARRRRI